MCDGFMFSALSKPTKPDSYKTSLIEEEPKTCFDRLEYQGQISLCQVLTL